MYLTPFWYIEKSAKETDKINKKVGSFFVKNTFFVICEQHVNDSTRQEYSDTKNVQLTDKSRSSFYGENGLMSSNIVSIDLSTSRKWFLPT